MSLNTELINDAENQLSCAGLRQFQPTTGSVHSRAKQSSHSTWDSQEKGHAGLETHQYANYMKDLNRS